MNERLSQLLGFTKKTTVLTVYTWGNKTGATVYKYAGSELPSSKEKTLYLLWLLKKDFGLIPRDFQIISETSYSEWVQHD
jgi:hypothetical protein